LNDVYLIVRLVGRGRVGRFVVGLVVSLVCGAVVGGAIVGRVGKSDGKNSGENEELYNHKILQLIRETLQKKFEDRFTFIMIED